MHCIAVYAKNDPMSLELRTQVSKVGFLSARRCVVLFCFSSYSAHVCHNANRKKAMRWWFSL